MERKSSVLHWGRDISWMQRFIAQERNLCCSQIGGYKNPENSWCRDVTQGWKVSKEQEFQGPTWRALLLYDDRDDRSNHQRLHLRLGLAYIHYRYYVQNRKVMRTYCTTAHFVSFITPKPKTCRQISAKMAQISASMHRWTDSLNQVNKFTLLHKWTNYS